MSRVGLAKTGKFMNLRPEPGMPKMRVHELNLTQDLNWNYCRSHAMSAGSLATLGATAPGAGPAPEAKKPRDIRVGMLTAPLRNLAFEEVLDLARRCHIAALEVVTEPGNPHIDPMTLGSAQVEAIKQKLGERRLEISGLSNFMNITAPGKSGELQRAMIKTVDAAVRLGVPTVCMNLGTPVQGMSRIKTNIPGFGNINWGQYVGNLRDVG